MAGPTRCLRSFVDKTSGNASTLCDGIRWRKRAQVEDSARSGPHSCRLSGVQSGCGGKRARGAPNLAAPSFTIPSAARSLRLDADDGRTPASEPPASEPSAGALRPTASPTSAARIEPSGGIGSAPRVSWHADAWSGQRCLGESAPQNSAPELKASASEPTRLPKRSAFRKTATFRVNTNASLKHTFLESTAVIFATGEKQNGGCS